MRALGHRPRKVGIPNSLTCLYLSVKVIERSLRNAGVEVVRTPKTTPEILRAGTTLCSADFCLPVRVLVGHVYTLAVKHPDLDFILVPNLCREREGSSNCSKYRDVSGVVIRSIAGTVGYVAKHASDLERKRLKILLGEEEVEREVKAASILPRILQPQIWSLDNRQELFNVYYSLYCDIHALPKYLTRLQPFFPERLKPHLAPHYVHCREAFERAYSALVENQPNKNKMEALLKDEGKPRLAIIGRNYLHEDGAISGDVKNFFKQNGVEVITAHDVPFEALRKSFEEVEGFYETHKLYQAFIDFIYDVVDGCIVIGSFGCHPDAFENEYFLDYCRAKGQPAWLFKYDEQSGSAGFKTRYETILRFLEQRRDERLKRNAECRTRRARRRMEDAEWGEREAACEMREAACEMQEAGGEIRNGECGNTSNRVTTTDDLIRSLYKTGARLPTAGDGVKRKPLLLFPHMSPILDCVVEEIFHQAGLDSIMLKPDIVSETTIELGNYRYSESCCPYALSTGSLVQVIKKAFERIEKEAQEKGLEKPEPRRIILLQGRGEGPCTYGWYAQLQALEMPKMFAEKLIAGNHTMEMVTVGLSGVADFVRELSQLGNAQKLKPILDFLDAAALCGGVARLPTWKKALLMWKLWKAVHPFKGTLTRTGAAKMEALEEIRAKTLIVRAHEINRGDTTAVWRAACNAMSAVHTLKEIEQVKREYLRKLDEVEQDNLTKPLVLVVGEIYVVLASFANRGTIENLMGREGIEVIEGMTLGEFIRTSLAEMKRRAWTSKPIIKPLLNYLKERNVELFQRKNRGEYARPFALHDVGGDGIRSVAEARHAIEHEGVDGIVHLYPFKCMPEMVAKTAITEIARFYGIRYLPLSFDKEKEIERLRTEVGTFAAMLKIQVEKNGGGDPNLYHRYKARELKRRQQLGKTLERIWKRQRSRWYCV